MSLQAINALNAKMAELRKQFQTEGQELFRGALTELFDKHPKLESVTLGGYVDYFNDGDECRFSMREYLTKVNGASVDSYGDDEGPNQVSKTIYGKTGETKMVKSWGSNQMEEQAVYGYVPNPDYDPELAEAFEEFQSILNATDETLMQDMFGSHFKVTATREGMEVEEYTDHE